MKLILLEELDTLIINENFLRDFVDGVRSAVEDESFPEEERNAIAVALGRAARTGATNSLKFIYNFFHGLLGGKEGDSALKVLLHRLPTNIIDYIKPIFKLFGFNTGEHIGADVRTDSPGAFLGSAVGNLPRALPVYWRG